MVAKGGSFGSRTRLQVGRRRSVVDLLPRWGFHVGIKLIGQPAAATKLGQESLAHDTNCQAPLGVCVGLR
jgi:hypothetical protein